VKVTALSLLHGVKAVIENSRKPVFFPTDNERVNNAECLSGLAMVQLLGPGTKVHYANSWTATDMHTGAAHVTPMG